MGVEPRSRRARCRLRNRGWQGLLACEEFLGCVLGSERLHQVTSWQGWCWGVRTSEAGLVPCGSGLELRGGLMSWHESLSAKSTFWHEGFSVVKCFALYFYAIDA